ncbi:indian hedgehog protein [Nilaparvata lugens]|uniref:indian hedgehog protein n=1 Tax=Nilaparvata lugens TaxID=108931 RepID=UPI00193D3AE7|nr:indian hedgehog protein [Nilaparvata lugens]
MRWGGGGRSGGGGARRWLMLGAALLLLVAQGVRSCGPGRGGAGRRSRLRKLTPLVFKQHIPNVSENTIAASGLAEGRVERHSSRFHNLVPNYNPDIIFKDEEGTGADRFMTQKCLERLNTLAISVMNQWPGVRLRVTEGWDEEGQHAEESLHYEGRAVDLTTSDRDRSKYGMLARMAVEAGFDWVYYESRSHIHCSVRSDSSQVGKTGGCFTGDSLVTTSDGRQLKLEEVRLGDEIMAVDPDTGRTVFSEVILFLDRDPQETRPFLRIATKTGAVIKMTPSHLLLRVNSQKPALSFEAVFADSVKPGDSVLLANTSGGDPIIDQVLTIDTFTTAGVYAPLTRTGTIVVNGVSASCYALINSQFVAHLSFAPLRIYLNLKESLTRFWTFASHPLTTNTWDHHNYLRKRRSYSIQSGIHWYPEFLYKISHVLIPSFMMRDS